MPVAFFTPALNTNIVVVPRNHRVLVMGMRDRPGVIMTAWVS